MIQEDEEIEERIMMKIVVDAYSREERAMGWYYYINDNLEFPFRAKCINKRSISPLKVGQEVKVIGMPDERECECDMFVTIEYGKDALGVPLSQLEIIDDNPVSKKIITDWHYWIKMGYEF
jgi:hypothetical protein